MRIHTDICYNTFPYANETLSILELTFCGSLPCQTHSDFITSIVQPRVSWGSCTPEGSISGSAGLMCIVFPFSTWPSVGLRRPLWAVLRVLTHYFACLCKDMVHMQFVNIWQYYLLVSDHEISYILTNWCLKCFAVKTQPFAFLTLKINVQTITLHSIWKIQ